MKTLQRVFLPVSCSGCKRGFGVFSPPSYLTGRYLRVQNQTAKAITNPNTSTISNTRPQISPWSSSVTQIHYTHPCPYMKFLLHDNSMEVSRMTEEAFGNSFPYSPFNPSFWAGSVYVSLVNLHTWEVLTFHVAQRVQQSFGICRIYFQNFL